MVRTAVILAVAAGATLAGALLAGCSAETNEKFLSILFGGAEKPPPPTRRVRRDLLQEIENLKRQLAEAGAAAAASKEGGSSEQRPPLELARTWKDAAEILPKDQHGNVDWMKALKDGSIAPRPGPDPRAAEQAVLTLDVKGAPKAGEAFEVTFSHEAHTVWLVCPSCHPAPFEMKAGATPITMAKINAGEACGACHGTVAFPASACGRCHTAREELALDVTLKGSMSVTFPHAAHTRWLPCESCHTDLFPMAAGETTMTMAAFAKGKYCGACHGTLAFATAKCGRCHAAREELALDVTLKGSMSVTFPHASHTRWLPCESCHTDLFPMAAGETTMTMDDFEKGRFCGACHGTFAFPVSACARCHPDMA